MASNATNPPDYGDYRDAEARREAEARRRAQEQSRRDAAPASDTASAYAVGPGEEPQAVTLRDRVRWGPVWAGLLTTFTLFLLLALLAYGIGLLANNGNTTSGASTWVIAIIGLIAFFVGGYVAEWTASIRGRNAGMLNGFMVWALGTTFILAFSLFGLGTLFGAVGSIVAQFVVTGRVTTVNVNPTQIAAATRGAAWGAFFSLLIAAIAATVGGMLAGEGRVPGRAHERVPATR